MIVRLNSSIVIEEPSDEIKAYCQENLVIANPVYAKKLRMNLWTGNTPKQLYLYETHGYKYILPFGVLKDILPLLTNTEIIKEFPKAESVDYKGTVPLYDYQEIAVEECYKANYGILQSKAGSGKTQMGVALITKFGKKALWLTHTLDLLDQSKKRAERYIDNSLIGTIQGGKVNISDGVTFATVQTMANLDLSKYKDIWDVVIVDECHKVCGTPTALTQFYKVLNNLNARHKYGLSATVHRADGLIKATYSLLGDIVYQVPDEAVEDKVMKVGISIIDTKVPMSHKALNTDGTLNYARYLNSLALDEKRNQLITTLLEVNSEFSQIVLSDRISHLTAILNALPDELKEKTVLLTGKSDKSYREKSLDEMRDKKKSILLATYSLCKEGLDIPCLERLILATPQKDFAVITQSIGRIARTYEGKTTAICYDLVDDNLYAKKSFKNRCTTYRKNGCYFL